MVAKRNNQVLIISSVQVENFRFSIIPVKKELIITPHKMALFHYSIISIKKQFPLIFLLHFSTLPPKIEPSISESESESKLVFFPYSATGW